MAYKTSNLDRVDRDRATDSLATNTLTEKKEKEARAYKLQAYKPRVADLKNVKGNFRARQRARQTREDNKILTRPSRSWEEQAWRTTKTKV